MLNYLKSEWFRITHTNTIYLYTITLMLGTLLMNIVLWWFNTFTPNFPYGIVSFSFSVLIGSIAYLFVMATILAGMLFSAGKDKTMKNTIAYGITRQQIFVGRCIVTSVIGTISMLIVLATYILSGILMLDGDWKQPTLEMIKGVTSNIFSIYAAVILILAIFQIVRKDILAIVIWYVIMFGIPRVVYLLGFRIDICKRIASWMPYVFLSTEVQANMSGLNGLWNTPEGLEKCIIAGIIGMCVFGGIGFVACKKQDI